MIMVQNDHSAEYQAGAVADPNTTYPGAVRILDAATAAGSTPTKAEFDAVVAKLNAALQALRDFGVLGI